MTSKELGEEIEAIVKDLCRFGGKQDKYALKVVEEIKKDLEVLENIKSKTLLLYSDRKRISQEYEKWCKDNNTMISDTTNMITWLLCFKLKEWLENEKV